MQDKKPTIIMEIPIKCGFPSPAIDSRENPLDFNDLLLKHRASTYCLRASGNSLEKSGIFDGDILVVDKSIKAKNNDLIVAEYEGEFTAKRLKIKGEKVYLHPENEDFEDIEILNLENFSIFGVITAVVRTLRQ
jgi:DNA polymerase V